MSYRVINKSGASPRLPDGKIFPINSQITLKDSEYDEFIKDVFFKRSIDRKEFIVQVVKEVTPKKKEVISDGKLKNE